MSDSSKPRWRRTEKRQYRPFPDLSSMLRSVAFSHMDKDSLTTNTSFLVDSEHRVTPLLKLDIGPGDAGLEVLSHPSIRLVLLVRFTSVRNTIKVEDWQISEAPEQYEFDPGLFDSQPSAFEVSLVIMSVDNIDVDGVKLPAYARLGSKTFIVRTDTTDNDFEVKFVSPEDLEQLGFSKNSLWVLNTLSEDFNSPPAECFEVLINKNVDGKLQGVAASNVAGRLYMEAMSAEIEFAIAQQVLAKSEEIEAEFGTLALLVDKISNETGLDHHRMREMAKNEPDKLRSYLQGTAKLARNIEFADVRRRRQ